MWISEPSGDIEPEVHTELYHILSQPHVVDATLLECLLQQQWFQERVQFFSNILEENRSSKLDTVLQGSSIVRVREFDHRQLVWAFHVLNPLVGLAWGGRGERGGVGGWRGGERKGRERRVGGRGGEIRHIYNV